MNTVPYTNARRDGRTQPDLVETIGDTDPRSRRYSRPGPNNRAARRARGLYAGFVDAAPYRRVRSLFPKGAKAYYTARAEQAAS